MGSHGVNLYRVYCAGDISYEDALAALRRHYPYVSVAYLEVQLRDCVAQCPLALPPSPELADPDQAA